MKESEKQEIIEIILNEKQKNEDRISYLESKELDGTIQIKVSEDKEGVSEAFELDYLKDYFRASFYTEVSSLIANDQFESKDDLVRYVKIKTHESLEPTKEQVKDDDVQVCAISISSAVAIYNLSDIYYLVERL